MSRASQSSGLIANARINSNERLRLGKYAGALQADRHADLTRRRPGQELAQRDEIRVGAVTEPSSPLDELGAEIAEVSDRPAKRRQPEPQEHEEDPSR